MDSPAIHQSRNYFKIPRGVQTGLEQSAGLGGSEREKASNVPFMLYTSQPCSPFWGSSQGRQSGRDSQLSRPVGALIKLRGSHRRRHLVSETLPFSLPCCLRFWVEGQRADFTHFGSHHCGEAATSVVDRVTAPLEQEHRDRGPRLCRCPAGPHLPPDCTLFELTVHPPKAWSSSWHWAEGGCQSQES